MRPGTPVDNQTDLKTVNFHVFVPPAWNGESVTEYVADDGISFDYQSGKRTRLRIEVVSVDGNVAILTKAIEEGFGPIDATFIIHGDPKSVRLNGSATTAEKAKVTLTGKPLDVQVLKI